MIQVKTTKIAPKEQSDVTRKDIEHVSSVPITQIVVFTNTTFFAQEEDLCSWLKKQRREGKRQLLVHGNSLVVRPGIRNTLETQHLRSSFAQFDAWNNNVVQALKTHEFPAISLSGSHERCIQAEPLNEELAACVAGAPTIHSGFFQTLLHQGLLPVVSPLCFDKHGKRMFIPPETLAESLSSSLNVDSLTFLTEQSNLWSGKHGQRTISVEQARSILPQMARLSWHWVPILQTAIIAVKNQCARVLIGSASSLRQKTATVIAATA
ncbi:MAG: hypothetical protein AAGJ35_10055 [Myxococcota bacterium]